MTVTIHRDVVYSRLPVTGRCPWTCTSPPGRAAAGALLGAGLL